MADNNDGGGNRGIIASGGATVAGANVASGKGATISVGTGHVSVGEPASDTASHQQIRQLLAELADGLHASDLPERADLADAAEAAREELLAEEPNLGMLRTVARSLRGSVREIAALASLAVTIEQAIRGL